MCATAWLIRKKPPPDIADMRARYAAIQDGGFPDRRAGGRWLDQTLMQKALGPGDTEPPDRHP